MDESEPEYCELCYRYDGVKRTHGHVPLNRSCKKCNMILPVDMFKGNSKTCKPCFNAAKRARLKRR